MSAAQLFALVLLAIGIIVFVYLVYRAKVRGKITTNSTEPNEDRRAEIKKEYATYKRKKRKSLGERKEEQRLKFISTHKDIIDKFLAIAERKVSVIDEYGDENWSVLKDEIERCIQKIYHRTPGYAFKFGSLNVRSTLDELFRAYHEKQRNGVAKVDTTAMDTMTGVEFETFLANRLRESGFDEVMGTPATGDQGADLVCTKGRKRVVIQAKRYEGNVGNKAVQEVISAMTYYNAQEGWVITNSTFTESARALANKASIKLIDKHDLSRLSEFVQSIV